MSNLLTEREFWVKYWENKENLAHKIPANYLFHDIITQHNTHNQLKTGIELGGFPGYYAVYLKKYQQMDVSLLDYFVHPPITSALLAANDLKDSDLQIIEHDLFTYQSELKYDLVISCGLIEHFKDTKDVIQRHVQLLNKNGTLIITLPNFKSINGWVQKTFDIENYNKHFIECMDIELLENIAQELGLKNIKCSYYGGFSLWLENKAEKNILTKIFVRSIWFVGKVISKIVPVQSKYTSPYIVLEAENNL